MYPVCICKLTIFSMQERPCTRCVKRNIGHLCHDEPRESVKKSKSEPENPDAQGEAPQNGVSNSDTANVMPQHTSGPDAGLNLQPTFHPPTRADSTPSVAPTDPVSTPQIPSMTSTNQARELHIHSASDDAYCLFTVQL